MRLFDTAVTRPILVAAVNLLLIAVGLGAALTLPIREFPDVDPPTVSITTLYEGAQAEVVEREVTRVVEESLSGVAGIRLIRSTTRDGTSSIRLDLVAGTDVDAAAADIRDRLSAVRADLPDDIEEPSVEKASADADPVLFLTLRSDDYDTAALTDLADRTIVDAIGAVSGVARIEIGGEKTYAMRIRLDRAAMAARGITASDVRDRLEAENVELPAGELETETQLIAIRADTRFAAAEEFAALSLLDQEGNRVRLGDVAEIAVGVEDEDTGFRVDGQEAVSIGVVRQSNANTLDVVSGVLAEVEALRDRLPPGVEIDEAYNEATFIAENLRNVGTTLALTVGIIVLVIFVFLGSARATVIPALTIPASVIPAAIVAATLGYSLNVLTILAVILAISLCTDDAVVIMENIRRRQRDGEPLLLASARATRQVGTAVFASALVLIAVVLPLAFLQGNVGLLFREFAVVLAAIVAFSTLAALSLSPMLSTLLFRDVAEPGRMERVVGRGLEALGGWYGRALGWAIDRPAATILAGVAFVAVAAIVFGAVEREVAPEEDRGALFIRVEGPEGVSPAYVDGKVAEIERLATELSSEDGPVASVLAILAPGGAGRADPTVGLVILRLRDWGEREETQAELVERLQEALPGVVGVQAFANSPSGLGQGGRPVEVALQGADRDVLEAWSEEVLARAATLPGVFGLDADYSVRTPQVAVSIDRSRAAALGIDARTVGETLQIMFGDTPVTRYVDREEEYDVILQGRPEDARVPSDIENVFVRAASGDLVPLSSVVVPREASTARTLERLDRQPSITLGAGVTGASLGEVLDEITALAEEAQPPGTLIGYTGQSLDFQESGNAVLVILVVIVVLVFLILAGQFESFRDPLVILISAPAAAAGGILILLATGQTLNIYSQIAMLLLIGLVAKNAILLVEFANQLRDGGKDARNAMIEAAATRLRPILMTTLATILGAVPLILESGAGAEARLAVGSVITSGTTLGTLLTLFIVPVLYVVLARSSESRNAREAELAEQEREHPEDQEDAAATPAE